MNLFNDQKGSLKKIHTPYNPIQPNVAFHIETRHLQYKIIEGFQYKMHDRAEMIWAIISIR